MFQRTHATFEHVSGLLRMYIIPIHYYALAVRLNLGREDCNRQRAGKGEVRAKELRSLDEFVEAHEPFARHQAIQLKPKDAKDAKRRQKFSKVSS